MFISKLIVLSFLIFIFSCNKDSFDSVIKNAKDTKKVDSIKTNKSTDIITDTLKNNQSTNFRLYPEGRKLQVTFEHEMGYEREIVIAKHWHQSGNKIYVILLDGRELYCNDVREIIE